MLGLGMHPLGGDKGAHYPNKFSFRHVGIPTTRVKFFKLLYSKMLQLDPCVFRITLESSQLQGNISSNM